MTDSADSPAVELRDLPPRPTVAVRVTAPRPSLGELFGLHLPNITEVEDASQLRTEVIWRSARAPAPRACSTR